MSAGPPGRERRPGARLRAAAVAILLAGAVASTGVWIAADTNDAPLGSGDAVAGSQVDADAGAAARDRQSERLGGQALVRTAALNRWFGSLWHGRRLALTLGAISLVLAGACAGIAALMDEPDD